MNFEKLIREAMNKLETLLKNAEAEKRDLTEEEQTVFDDLEKDIKSYKNALERQKRIEGIRADLDKPVDNPVTNINVGRTRNFDKPWNNFGEFLGAVKNAYDPARAIVDDRLIPDRVGVQNAGTGMQVAVSSDGGFMVQRQFVESLMESVALKSAVFGKITNIPIGEGSNGIVMPALAETSRADGSRFGGVRAYWANEGATATATKPKIRELTLKLEKLLAFVYMTEELLRDGNAMEAFVRKTYSDEIAFKLDDAIFNGTGVGTPLGILNSPALVSVAKESGQTAATVVFENVVKMWARLPAGAQTRAVWLINQEVLPQLMLMSLAVGTAGGGPVFLPAGGASVSPYSTLMGRPIIPVEQLPALGTAGDILLADMEDYIGIDKRGLEVDTSIHVQFLYDEMVFRFRYRFNGTPYTNSALTPYKGSATISPYVTVAVRA